MQSPAWSNENEFSIGDVNFLCALGDYERKSDERRLVLLKDRKVIADCGAILSAHRPRTMLEFGIYQGGSSVFYALTLGLQKFVGIDICQPIPHFDAFCTRHAVGNVIRTYYDVTQTDDSRIRGIAHAEFRDAPLDVVVDDASHRYDFTRRTFEIAFPLLRPGGLYIIEDWGWAHWPNSRIMMGHPSLSALVMELNMLCASRSDLIDEVRVFPSFVVVRKSMAAPPLGTMNLDSLYNKRGLEIVTVDRPHFGGIARLFGQRMGLLWRNKMHSIRKRLPKRFPQL